jgi:hypothetical protein
LQRLTLHHVPLKALHFILERANLEKLHAKGDPKPDGDSLNLYRAVSGHGAARRLRSISWMSDLEKAKWFTNRLELLKPASFMSNIARDWVYVFYSGRNENEFICIIPENLKLKRVWKN